MILKKSQEDLNPLGFFLRFDIIPEIKDVLALLLHVRR